MIQLEMSEVQNRFPELLDQVARGERVVVCKDKEPVAEIRGVSTRRRKPRPIGLAKGQFQVPDTFFEPLPDDVIESFYGSDA